MKNIIILIISISFLFLNTACEKAILGTEPANDPETNFELFWEDFDQHYALFGVKGIDWDNIYQQYRPQVTATTTDQELWSIMTQMIEELDDGHTYLLDRVNQIQYESGSALNDQAEEEFNLDLIYDKYVTSIADLTGNRAFSYGQMKTRNIGYIYLGNMEYTDPAQIDQVMEDLNQYPAIIVDVRNNGGGQDAFAARIASAFADGEHFIYTVQNRSGPNHDDFESPREFFTIVGADPYLKPVILLADRFSASAAEIFGLHMNAFDHVLLMGDSTAGDYSGAGNHRFLPNGWDYYYSVQKFLLPDGRSLEGIGNVPDVYSKNTKADIEAGNDIVLEKAMELLMLEYGIK